MKVVTMTDEERMIDLQHRCDFLGEDLMFVAGKLTEQVDKLKAEKTRLRDLLYKTMCEMSLMEEDDYYCPSCQAFVVATYDERCSRCGTYIAETQDQIELLEEIRNALKEIEDEDSDNR